MSTFKKVVSLMLCFAMLLGTVAIAGNSIVAPKAYAKEPVSGIDSYADLAAKYDNFVYLGLEFYEKTEDGKYTLTDYKVQAGQDLRMYFYIKTDMYLGGGNPYIIFDRNFFDVTNGATNLTYDTAYDANKTDYPTESYPSLVTGSMNPAHSAVVDYGVTVTMTTKWARNVNGFTEKTQTNWHGIDLAESDEWDFVFGSWMRDNNGLTSWEAKDDAYYYSWDIKVREYMPDGTTVLADGTTGFVKNDHRMFKRYDASTVTSKRVSYVAVAPTQLNYASIVANNKADYLTIDSFIIDDCNHTFTIDSKSVPGEYAEDLTATFTVDGEQYGDVVTAEEGGAIAAPATDPVKAGYSFSGWALEGTEDVLTFPQTMGAENVVYVAIFEALAPQTATFYVDGEEFDTFEIYAGGTIVAPEAPAGENGRTFLYWSSSATENVQVSDWTMPEGGASFYAVYTEAVTHNAIYYVNGAQYKSVAVIEDNDYELIAAPELDTTLYRFLGWSTVEDDATAIVTGTQAMGTADAVYYAIIEEIVYYTVTYYNEGEVYGTPVKYEENTAYTVSTDTLTKEGYTFLGWSTAEDDADAIVSGEQTITADVALYAVYSVNQYDVTFNMNGASSENVTNALDFGAEITAPADPERTGYTFAGWAERANGTALETLGTVPAKNVTFYALWTANTYTATFYADEEGTTVSETVEIKYNANLAAKVKPAKEGYEFAGWVDADGNFASVAAGALGLGKYTKTEDTSYYPSWTQLPCSITIMTKDFVTGEWKVALVKYGKETDKITAAQIKTFREGLDPVEAYNWDGEVYYNADPANPSAKIGPDEATATAIGRNDTINYNGHQIIWIQAEPVFTVEYNVPVFDETAGEYTSEYETFTATTRPSISNTVLVSVADTAPVDGYVFKGWVTAEGEAANYSTATTNYIFPVDIATGAKIVVYAKYELKTYDIKFFGVGHEFNGNATIIIKDGFKIGDTIDLDAAEYVFDSPADLAGQTAAMPIIDKENSEQPVRFSGRDGYKFTGYYFYKDNTAAELDGITVTEEFVEKYAVAGANGANDYIQIGSTWEAQSYNAVFKYETAEGTKEIVVTVPVGTALNNFDPTKDAEQMALITAGAPEGSVFTRWSYDQELTATGAMVAGGVTYTAIYNKIQLRVYVDYNNGGEPQGLDYVKYGDDTMAVGDETGEGRGIYYVVRTIQLDAYRPTETHESVGWTVYHVHDEADVNDPTKWHEGVNDEGTNEAKYTLIYKNEWKQHGEFFFTLYGTDGKIFCALGKNFKLYFWETRRSCDKDDASFLHNPELLVLFLKPEFVKDESGLCLKLTPFALNRSLFTFDNIGALFEALGTLLKSLINGEL